MWSLDLQPDASKGLLWGVPLAIVQKLRVSRYLSRSDLERSLDLPLVDSGGIGKGRADSVRLIQSASLAPILSRSEIRLSNITSLHGVDRRGALRSRIDPMA